LTHVNILQLVSHHGTDSVRDLGLLCRSKMIRPVGIMVANGNHSVFLTSVIQSHLDQFDLGSARFGKISLRTDTGQRPGVWPCLILRTLFKSKTRKLLDRLMEVAK